MISFSWRVSQKQTINSAKEKAKALTNESVRFKVKTSITDSELDKIEIEKNAEQQVRLAFLDEIIAKDSDYSNFMLA